MSSNCALILAAGRGERLRPLTDSIPKPLLKVGKLRLIEYHILNLAKAGVSNIFINRSHLRNMFDSLLHPSSYDNVHITWLDEPQGALETAGAIINAFNHTDADRLLVVNGDIWCDYNFRHLANLPGKDNYAHIVLTQNPEHNPGGDFSLDSGKVCECEEGRTSYTFTGIGQYRRSLFEDCEDGRLKLAPLLRQYIAMGRISGSIHHHEWMDIGTIERLEALRSRLFETSQ